MKKVIIFLLSVCYFVAPVVASAETIFLDTNFSDWTAGTIDGGYSLPGGWTLVADGMEISSEYAEDGTQTLKCPDGSLGCIRFVWSAVDPTLANPFKVTFRFRLGNQTKVQKGAFLFCQNVLDGNCDPALYWYEYPVEVGGERVYRVRDRVANCMGNTEDSVWGTQSYYQTASSSLKQWVEWEVECDDTGAVLNVDGSPVHTFGVPNGTMDNFAAIELGASKTNFWSSDIDHNGDLYFDRIRISQGPFDPTPTPTNTLVPTDTPTSTPTYTPMVGGVILAEDFEVDSVDDLLDNWLYINRPGDPGDEKIEISEGQFHQGAKSLYHRHLSLGQLLEFVWGAVDPTNTQRVRLEYWMRFSYYDSQHEKKVLLLNNSSGTGWFAWGMQTYEASDTYYLRSRNAWSDIDGTLAPAPSGATEDTWHHFVVTMDGDGAIFEIDDVTIFDAGLPLDDEFDTLRIGWDGNVGNAWFDDFSLTCSYGTDSGIRKHDWASY